jgi:hypothetical protein
MSNLKLDETTNDLVVENGNLVLTSGVEAVRQHLSCKLKTFLGEWFLDGSKGVPYYEDIFKKNFNPITVDGIFKEQILSTPGIIELLDFDMDIDVTTRSLTIIVKARSQEGIINFTETIP